MEQTREYNDDYDMESRDSKAELREQLTRLLKQSMDALEDGRDPDQEIEHLSTLSGALSAVCLEDIANTLRVLAFGAVSDETH